VCQTLAVTPEKPALVLLHLGTSSGRIWQELFPLLSAYHEVHAPTLLGHRGGPEVQRRPATITDVGDSAERYLDEQGLDRPHLVANSMGGGVAIELARRGRAATICALSPAGFWSASDGSAARVLNRVRVGVKILRLIYCCTAAAQVGCRTPDHAAQLPLRRRAAERIPGPGLILRRSHGLYGP
jgi:pimeloyl-ACP methyl ester carboxylesterase